MVNEKAIRQAIYQKLNVAAVTSLLGSGSASIVHGVAPSAARYPLCLFQRQSDVSTLRFGGNAYDDQLWLVKGVVRLEGGNVSPSLAEDIDKAVRDLLDFGTLTISGADDMHLARQTGIEYPEVEGDTIYRHAGSIYRLAVQST